MLKFLDNVAKFVVYAILTVVFGFVALSALAYSIASLFA